MNDDETKYYKAVADVIYNNIEALNKEKERFKKALEEINREIERCQSSIFKLNTKSFSKEVNDK